MAAMPRRPLGGTGLHVSLLGFGASPLGSVFESIDEEEGVRAVHEAVRCGINFFDVSPFYGDTRAESVLGRALKTLPRDQVGGAESVGVESLLLTLSSVHPVHQSGTLRSSLVRLQRGAGDAQRGGASAP